MWNVLALLGICDRIIRTQIPKASVYRRLWRRVPALPKTLGEHLRCVRIDRALKQTEVAALLGVAYQTVVKWEHGIVPVARRRVLGHRTRVRRRSGSFQQVV